MPDLSRIGASTAEKTKKQGGEEGKPQEKQAKKKKKAESGEILCYKGAQVQPATFGPDKKHKTKSSAQAACKKAGGSLTRYVDQPAGEA